MLTSSLDGTTELLGFIAVRSFQQSQRPVPRERDHQLMHCHASHRVHHIPDRLGWRWKHRVPPWCHPHHQWDIMGIETANGRGWEDDIYIYVLVNIVPLGKTKAWLRIWLVSSGFYRHLESHLRGWFGYLNFESCVRIIGTPKSNDEFIMFPSNIASWGYISHHWTHSIGHHAVKNAYPLVNSHITMENHHFMGKLTISMAIFNSYVKLPEGNNLWKQSMVAATSCCVFGRLQPRKILRAGTSPHIPID